MQTLISRKCNFHNYNYENIIEFLDIVKDLLENTTVKQMRNYRQHYNSNCYNHCLEVAYWSYLICKKFNLDYVSAARAGVLHDLFLYDWRHSKKRLHLKRFHAFIHPQIALENALKLTALNNKEKDIILKHMWPVNFFHFPKYKESFIVTITDKLSALKAFHDYYEDLLINNKFYRYSYLYLFSIIISLF